tara:strand:- start:16 stop:156 length:141 start_codon:yes stop_codon:yes gene_type:complete
MLPLGTTEMYSGFTRIRADCAALVEVIERLGEDARDVPMRRVDGEQ